MIKTGLGQNLIMSIVKPAERQKNLPSISVKIKMWGSGKELTKKKKSVQKCLLATREASQRGNQDQKGPAINK